MNTKLDVKWETLRPELLLLEPIVDAAYRAFNLVPICTSTNDGRHRPESLHYLDCAFDLRVKVLSTQADQEKLWRVLKTGVDEKYPTYFDVLLEDAGGNNAHIHVEASPVLLKLMGVEGH